MKSAFTIHTWRKLKREAASGFPVIKWLLVPDILDILGDILDILRTLPGLKRIALARV